MRFTQMDAASTDVFSDVSANAWYYHYVMGAAQYGWITGYPDGTFRPESKITRAELAAIINRMLGRSADKAFIAAHSGQISQFSDVSPTHWAYYDVMEGSNAVSYTHLSVVDMAKVISKDDEDSVEELSIFDKK